ncbi:hypothetical protein HHI36_004382 [Cryptolaemus montrouzieri]|uniref:Uncharacterized protein n=1 Tax=Cryptolaemus montrouzieri TaxID=559131 RepID=A0ABD2NRD7_9CUCU
MDFEKCDLKKLSFAEISVCDKCDWKMCKSCSRLSSTEMREAVLQKRNMLSYCPDCIGSIGSPGLTQKTIERIFDAKISALSSQLLTVINKVAVGVDDLRESIIQLMHAFAPNPSALGLKKTPSASTVDPITMPSPIPPTDIMNIPDHISKSVIKQGINQRNQAFSSYQVVKGISEAMQSTFDQINRKKERLRNNATTSS